MSDRPVWRSWVKPGVAHLVVPGRSRSVCGLGKAPFSPLDPDDHLCGNCKKRAKDETPCTCLLHRKRVDAAESVRISPEHGKVSS